MDEAGSGKKNAGSHEKLAAMMQIVETMLNNASQVGCSPIAFESSIADGPGLALANSEDNLDDEDEASVGPSARRMKKKKRRSGSISRVFGGALKGIQKAMSRSATPVAPRRRHEGVDDVESLYATPMPLQLPASARFTSPRMPVKRKARAEAEELSPKSKQQRKLTGVEMTPKARSRSFSVKRFTSKSFRAPTDQQEGGGGGGAVLNNYSPIPSRSTLKMATPSTPAQVDLPRQGQDILTPPSGHRRGRSRGANYSNNDADSSATSSAASSAANSPIGRHSRASLAAARSMPEVVLPRRRSASPAERKIGGARKQRPEARKARADEVAATKPSLHNFPVEKVRARLRRGQGGTAVALGATPGRAKHSPLRVMPPSQQENQKEKSLVNLREDINSFIEKSFGAPNASEPFEDDVFEQTRTLPSTQPPPTSFLRRQSSAFEFSRPSMLAGGPEGMPVLPEMRRQSSAFEIAARNRERHPQSYQPFNVVETRASLRRKSSSVRDLVKRLEASAKKNGRDGGGSNGNRGMPPHRGDQQPDPSATEEGNDEASEAFGGGEEEWTDAAEFFKQPVFKQVLEEDVGCKRSSIIKIRKENRGKVSQSVETFTRKPKIGTPSAMMPPPAAPGSVRRGHSTIAGPPARRQSARLGVSSSSTSGSPVGTPNQARRHIRSGIRTSVNYKHLIKEDGKQEVIKETTNANPASTVAAAVRTPDAHAKKRPNRRRGHHFKGERRHLTIGYSGEVRSPLKERANNVVATVQRSKSAQTPLHNKPAKRRTAAQENTAAHCMVTRSQSMRSPAKGTLTISLPEGNIVYRAGTPSGTPRAGSGVRRHQSERSATPRKHHLKTAAAVHAVRNSPRVKRMY